MCSKHHKDSEAIHYQAKQTKNQGNIDAVEHAFSDPAKAKLALEEFVRENPEGRFCKRLIDWTAFKRKCGKRSEVRNRQEEDPYYGDRQEGTLNPSNLYPKPETLHPNPDPWLINPLPLIGIVIGTFKAFKRRVIY